MIQGFVKRCGPAEITIETSQSHDLQSGDAVELIAVGKEMQEGDGINAILKLMGMLVMVGAVLLFLTNLLYGGV
jgi:hypothetical protein